MNEDWEQVTPFLQDMQHCAEEDYFNPQEVSGNIKSAQPQNLYYPSATDTGLCAQLALPTGSFELDIIKRY